MAHGVFVDGVWHTEWYNTASSGGRFVPGRAGVSQLGHAGRQRRTVRAAAVLPPSAGAITSTSRSPAPMRTAR